MKRSAKSLFFRLEEPTEEQLMAHIEESLFALMHNLRNPTVEDFVAYTKILLAPVIRKALQRTKVENRSIREANRNRQWKSERTKKAALVIAAELIQKNRRLGMPGHKSQLADLVSKRLKQQGINKTPRTIRGWLAEAPSRK